MYFMTVANNRFFCTLALRSTTDSGLDLDLTMSTICEEGCYVRDLQVTWESTGDE